MQKDRFGRNFLRGDEGCPNDIRCFRCDKIPYKQGDPYGVMIFDYARADNPLRKSAFALCQPCSVAMFEWFHPGENFAQNAAYIAGKDQAMARIPEHQAHWNEGAPEGHRVDD